jgi:hypothetical protein
VKRAGRAVLGAAFFVLILIAALCIAAAWLLHRSGALR